MADWRCDPRGRPNECETVFPTAAPGPVIAASGDAATWMLGGDLVATPSAFDTRPTGHYELWRLAPRAAAADRWLCAVGLVFDDSRGHEAGSCGYGRGQRSSTDVVASAGASNLPLGYRQRLGSALDSRMRASRRQRKRMKPFWIRTPVYRRARDSSWA